MKMPLMSHTHPQRPEGRVYVTPLTTSRLAEVLHARAFAVRLCTSFNHPHNTHTHLSKKQHNSLFSSLCAFHSSWYGAGQHHTRNRPVRHQLEYCVHHVNACTNTVTRLVTRLLQTTRIPPGSDVIVKNVANMRAGRKGGVFFLKK